MPNTPEDHVRVVARWVSKNPDSFRIMRTEALAELSKGNCNLRRGDMFKILQDRGVKLDSDMKYRQSNSDWSIISRYLVMIDPPLAKCIRFRAAYADTVDLRRIWKEEVGTDPFKVNNRKEAQKLWHVS